VRTTCCLVNPRWCCTASLAAAAQWHCMAKQVQTVVTTPANSKCALVMLYVLFEPVRFFELAVFPSLLTGTLIGVETPLLGRLTKSVGCVRHA
jgi:hypothetical protein